MNHTELIPTIFPNGLPDEFVSIKQELDSLSGDALDTSLKHWEALLLSDTTDTSLILSVFLEVCHRVTSSTPSKDCLLLLDFLSQLNYHRLKAGGLSRSKAQVLRLKVALGAKAPSFPD